jgi:hypothetical protein
MIRGDELARVLAKSVTGADPDTVVVRSWPLEYLNGGFFVVPARGKPTEGEPLWRHFLEAADEALKLFEASL